VILLPLAFKYTAACIIISRRLISNSRSFVVPLLLLRSYLLMPTIRLNLIRKLRRILFATIAVGPFPIKPAGGQPITTL